MPHLSSLELDELSAGVAAEAATAHLASCAECRARLDAVSAARTRVEASPSFHQGLAALEAQLTPARPRLRLVRWVPLVAAAALIAIVVTTGRQGQDGERFKGAPTVELLRSSGAAVTTARAGERVSVAVGGQGKRYALVFSIDEAGEVDQVWPKAGPAGALAAGARVPLDATFQVTPGAFVLVAFFTDDAQPERPVRDALERTEPAQRFEAPPPTGFGVTAQARIEVTP